MRLIDADKLREDILKWTTPSVSNNSEIAEIDISSLGKLIGIMTIMKIKEQPTVFSKDKILYSLYDELRPTSKEMQKCHNKNILHFDYIRGYADGIAKAIEIVKGGDILND